MIMKTAAKILAITFFLAFTISQPRAQTNATNEGGANSIVATNNSPPPAQVRHRRSDDWGNAHFSPLSLPIAGMIMVVFIVAIGAISRHQREKMLHETLRTMVEKGQPVSSDLITQLGSRHYGDRSNRRRSGRLLPGLICTGIGTAFIIRDGWHSTAGLILLFIGAAFLIVWLLERNQNGDQQPPKP